MYFVSFDYKYHISFFESKNNPMWMDIQTIYFPTNQCNIFHTSYFALATFLTHKNVISIDIARNDRWFAYLHIQNGGSKIIWNLTYSWTGNFLLAWAGQIAGIENQTMHRFEQYLKILQLYHENSRFPPSFKFWSVSTIQKHWEEVKKCILHGFQDLKALFLQSPF